MWTVGDVLKAQIASESLIILGFIIIFLIPLLFYFISYSSEKLSSISDYQTIFLINRICDNAAQVWYQGEGAKKSVIVFYPVGLKNIFLGGDLKSSSSLKKTLFGDLEAIPSQGINDRTIIIESDLFNRKKTFIDHCPAPIKSTSEFFSLPPESYLNYKPSKNEIYLPSGMVKLNFEYIKKGSTEPHSGDYILITRG